MKRKEITHIISSERDSIVKVAILFIVGACAVFFLRDRSTDNSVAETSDTIKATSSYSKDKSYAVEPKAVHLQSFDPNTADSTLLLGLGLAPWQVRSIYKYRASGGVYTCPEDFARLYGLSVKKYRELLPYIRIGDDYRSASEVYGKANHSGGYRSSGDSHLSASSASQHDGANPSNGNSPYPQKLKAGQMLKINNADTLALRTIPGIGPYFARKIVRYREQLGGFVSKNQLLEIADFPESALPYIEISSAEASAIRRLNINKASAEQLRSHPYITFSMAKQITEYRRLRGNIKNLDDLKLLPLFTPETIQKLRPYIEY